MSGRGECWLGDGEGGWRRGGSVVVAWLFLGGGVVAILRYRWVCVERKSVCTRHCVRSPNSLLWCSSRGWRWLGLGTYALGHFDSASSGQQDQCRLTRLTYSLVFKRAGLTQCHLTRFSALGANTSRRTRLSSSPLLRSPRTSADASFYSLLCSDPSQSL